MYLDELLPFWEKLNDTQRALLRGVVHERRFAKGSVIHSNSENCVGLLAIVEGQLRVYTVSDEGRELTLYRLFERDICLFSATCIMASLQFNVLIRAQQDTVVLQIPPDVYKRFMQESAPVANYTNELMASRFSDVMWLLDQLQNKKLDTRLAAFLVEESRIMNSDVLTLTHEEIANHLGSAREVVTRMVRYFQSEGLVRSGRGALTLLDNKRLASLAGESLR